jgi:zinc/manganese transport system ATP-binding protein
MPDVSVVRFEKAGVRLGGKYIWRRVDLDVRQGEFVAILGPNGAGKSTLIKAALGLIPLAEGSLAVRTASTSRQRRRRLFATASKF